MCTRKGLYGQSYLLYAETFSLSNLSIGLHQEKRCCAKSFPDFLMSTAELFPSKPKADSHAPVDSRQGSENVTIQHPTGRYSDVAG
jgi:hypothetical protein